jgi:hypothetical protein
MALCFSKRWRIAAHRETVKNREPRRKVLIRARLKSAAGWHDACIVDLSRRGAGLQAANPPPLGSYVEIRRGDHLLVARVVWSRRHRFGVATQDEVPVDLVVADRAPPRALAAKTAPANDRRRSPRSPEEQAEHSRTWARRAQFAVAAGAGVLAALAAGSGVREALAAPLGQVAEML